MGSYINPPHISKEQFLEAHGIEVTREDAAAFDFSTDDDILPVVLVNNGPFTAAAIAHSQRELDEFTRLDDDRPRKWFLVERVLLEPYM